MLMTLPLNSLLNLLLAVCIFGVICYAMWWFVGYLKLPEPWDKIARLVVGLIVLYCVFQMVLSLPLLRLR